MPEACALPVPLGFQVGDPTVVDVAVRLEQAPTSWIGFECPRHVLVDEALQVDAPGVPDRADDHVRA